MNARFCSACGGEIAPGARFCASCGVAVAGGTSAARPAAPQTRPGPAPSSAIRTAAPETTVFELKPLAIRSLRECLVSILTLGIGWVCYRVARMGRVYVVTTQRIEIREGVVTKRRTTLDLFRIEDFEIVEPFFLRMRGAGNLRIWSMDQSAPDVVLEAVPDVQSVYEKLREMTRTERGRNQVRVVEGM